ncbi:DUF998 domain-containing protein [Micromonospora sp. NPDC047074]|uniref:DUF998 domain-containing protein n=1 Tax=Micromonospora sp. NPDC047074 TaxID=3154339 RepID=UPI0033D1212E
MKTDCTPAGPITSLLGYGVIAGPFYVAVALAQALTRDGFDLRRHAWSMLANGDFGWIQIVNLVLTGLMTVAAAVGLRRALAPGRGATWGPYLIGAYGVSLVGAGIFRADPGSGFPVGAPETVTPSWHGMLHLAVAGVGFLCLSAACLVLANRLSREGRRGLAWFSRGTGVFFVASFAGLASGAGGPAVLVFVAGVVTVCAWLAVLSAHYYRATA